MKTIDRQLYDFLHENLCAISEEWLALRKRAKGSIYSIDAGGKAEAILREQNRLTNLTVASNLLEDEEAFIANKKEWAHVVAESRVNSQTPIPEVLDALSKVRITYWEFIEQFITSQNDFVSREDILRWNRLIHTAFDELNVEFSKMYYEIIDGRLVAQLNLIEELSAPIIKINDFDGILPIVGDIDATRAQKLLDYVPVKCTEEKILHLYIDLSGVSIIDTMVAHQIHRITQILKLLGIGATVTGIRPEIAQTAIQLGLDFTKIDTFSSLQQALKSATH